jgi:hypothetical protein
VTLHGLLQVFLNFMEKLYHHQNVFFCLSSLMTNVTDSSETSVNSYEYTVTHLTGKTLYGHRFESLQSHTIYLFLFWECWSGLRTRSRDAARLSSLNNHYSDLTSAAPFSAHLLWFCGRKTESRTIATFDSPRLQYWSAVCSFIFYLRRLLSTDVNINTILFLRFAKY